MGIIVNGTTIPENTANVLTVNGVNITDVILDGTNYWHQSLFSALWSGSSLANNGITVGFMTSNNLFRSYHNMINSNYGPWNTANSDGTFTSGGDNQIFSIKCGGNWIQEYSGSGGGTAMVYYNKDTKTFTGGTPSSSTYSWFLETSGGLLRQHNTTSVGAWISLT